MIKTWKKVKIVVDKGGGIAYKYLHERKRWRNEKLLKSSCDESEKLDLDSDNRLRLYVMYARPVN